MTMKPDDKIVSGHKVYMKPDQKPASSGHGSAELMKFQSILKGRGKVSTQTHSKRGGGN